MSKKKRISLLRSLIEKGENLADLHTQEVISEAAKQQAASWKISDVVSSSVLDIEKVFRGRNFEELLREPEVQVDVSKDDEKISVTCRPGITVEEKEAIAVAIGDYFEVNDLNPNSDGFVFSEERLEEVVQQIKDLLDDVGVEGRIFNDVREYVQEKLQAKLGENIPILILPDGINEMVQEGAVLEKEKQVNPFLLTGDAPELEKLRLKAVYTLSFKKEAEDYQARNEQKVAAIKAYLHEQKGKYTEKVMKVVQALTIDVVRLSTSIIDVVSFLPQRSPNIARLLEAIRNEDNSERIVLDTVKLEDVFVEFFGKLIQEACKASKGVTHWEKQFVECVRDEVLPDFLEEYFKSLFGGSYWGIGEELRAWISLWYKDVSSTEVIKQFNDDRVEDIEYSYLRDISQYGVGALHGVDVIAKDLRLDSDEIPIFEKAQKKAVMLAIRVKKHEFFYGCKLGESQTCLDPVCEVPPEPYAEDLVIPKHPQIEPLYEVQSQDDDTPELAVERQKVMGVQLQRLAYHRLSNEETNVLINSLYYQINLIICDIIGLVSCENRCSPVLAECLRKVRAVPSELVVDIYKVKCVESDYNRRIIELFIACKKEGTHTVSNKKLFSALMRSKLITEIVCQYFVAYFGVEEDGIKSDVQSMVVDWYEGQDAVGLVDESWMSTEFYAHAVKDVLRGLSTIAVRTKYAKGEGGVDIEEWRTIAINMYPGDVNSRRHFYRKRDFEAVLEEQEEETVQCVKHLELTDEEREKFAREYQVCRETLLDTEKVPEKHQAQARELLEYSLVRMQEFYNFKVSSILSGNGGIADEVRELWRRLYTGDEKVSLRLAAFVAEQMTVLRTCVSLVVELAHLDADQINEEDFTSFADAEIDDRLDMLINSVLVQET